MLCCRIHSSKPSHQWRSGFALKTDRREVLSLNPGRAYRPKRTKFSVVFSETRVKYGLGSLRKTPTEDIPLVIPGPTSGRLDSKPTTKQPTQTYINKFKNRN